MFSRIKRIFDSGVPTHSENYQRLFKKMERLKKQNEELANRLQQQGKRNTSDQTRPQKFHIEFFLYDAKSQKETAYSEEDIHRYPMMGFTIHFLEEKGRDNQPEWLTYVLTGFEKTLDRMKVTSHQVNQQNLYSQFIDLKVHHQAEVKKCIYLLFQQLYQWQLQGKDRVSFRVHIGGDDLYQDLLNSHLEAV